MTFFKDLVVGKTWSLTKIPKKEKISDHKLLYGIAPGYLQFMVIDRSEIFNSIL